MPPIGSEKALRALVVELAEATVEDIAAVLAMLPPRPRAVVRSLLAAYTDLDDVFELEATPAAANISGLSDWLAARVTGEAREGDDYRITARTEAALRAQAKSIPSVKGLPQLDLRLDGAGA